MVIYLCIFLNVVFVLFYTMFLFKTRHFRIQWYDRKYALKCADLDNEFETFSGGDTPDPQSWGGRPSSDPSHAARRAAPWSGPKVPPLSDRHSRPNFKSWLRPWIHPCIFRPLPLKYWGESLSRSSERIRSDGVQGRSPGPVSDSEAPEAD
jgi:hypothetical protein